MAITTVTTNSIVTAAQYNEIQSDVAGVITGYYKLDVAQMRSNTVSSGATVNVADWQELYDDLSRAMAHQTNTRVSATTSTWLTATYVNAIISATNFIVANTATLHSPAQLGLATLSTGARDTFTATDWTSTLTHTVTYDWFDGTDNDISIQQFFRLGGRLVMQPAYVRITGATTTLERAWMGHIDWMRDQLQLPVNQFSLSDYNKLGISRAISLTTSTLVGGLPEVMTMRMAVSGFTNQQVTATMTLAHAGTAIRLDVYNTATYYYSRGDADQVIQGLAATQPELTSVLGFGDASPFSSSTSKILSINSPVGGFSWRAYESSTATTITLRNTGNSSLTISGITFTNNGDVVAIPDYSGIGSFPVVMPPRSTTQFDLTYSGITVGTWQNSFTVASNNTAGPYTVRFTQVVSTATFRTSLSPASWSTSSGSLSELNQTFNIIPSGYAINTSSATLNGHAGFTFPNRSQSASITADSDVLVVFNPGSSPTGTYTSTLTVVSIASELSTATTVTNLRVNYTQPANQRLGSWLSALGADNSVVGVSYDIISGVRYLTVGIGGGGDLAPPLATGGISYMSASTLKFDADAKFTSGPVVYKSKSESVYCRFLNDFGVWVNPDLVSPTDSLVNRSYTIQVPTSGNYAWSLAMDDYGWFDIDGTLVGDLRNMPNPYQVEHTGEVYLTAGTHELTWYVTNTKVGYTGASAAIRLKCASDNLVIWSTLTPVRSLPAYAYWREVYRIPLTLGAGTYRSKNHYIKYYGNTTMDSYGAFFGSDGSFFTATDDGVGNVGISFQSANLRRVSTNGLSVATDATLYNLQYVPYYYSLLGTRYSQLSAPVGDSTQTQYFLGFNRLGATRTSIVSYPK
jgi:hypothetical protein